MKVESALFLTRREKDIVTMARMQVLPAYQCKSDENTDYADGLPVAWLLT